MTRRQFVLGLSVSALALAIAIPGAEAARIVVDMSPLESRWGPGPQIDLIRRRIGQGMNQAFAGRPGTITVRIYQLSLAASTFQSYGGSGTDYMRGEVIANGRSVPILVTQNADSAGYWRSPNFDQSRVASLADAFVGWAVRKI